jgi:hypothetical protein
MLGFGDMAVDRIVRVPVLPGSTSELRTAGD